MQIFSLRDFFHFSSNGPVSVRSGRGGNTVSESHTHSLTPLQERHQGGCGERGKESETWKTNMQKKKIDSPQKRSIFVMCCMVFTHTERHCREDWLPPRYIFFVVDRSPEGQEKSLIWIVFFPVFMAKSKWKRGFLPWIFLSVEQLRVIFQSSICLICKL